MTSGSWGPVYEVFNVANVDMSVAATTHGVRERFYDGLRDLVAGRPSPYVMFNNLPRVGDAERFMALVSQ